MKNCMYCAKEGMAIPSHIPGSFVYLCKIHNKIMNIPEMAIPFMRGRLANQLRGTMSKEDLDKQMDVFLKLISSWKPKYH